MNRTLSWVFVLTFISVFVTDYYSFYYKKDYKFTVEAPCDPSTRNCFKRDCDGPDGCPPNNFSSYRVFLVNASDFKNCKDNSCLTECESGAIMCKEEVPPTVSQ